MNIAGQLMLIQRREGSRLQPRPFDAEAVGVRAQLRHQVNVFRIAVIVIARDLTMPAVLRREVGPLIVDVALHLCGRGGGAPEKTSGKLSARAVAHWAEATACCMAANNWFGA